MQALLSPSRLVSRTAAQVIGAFGAVDFPEGRWSNLIDILVANVASTATSVESKVASLEALGYMCESLESDNVPSTEIDKLLTTIVQSLREDVPEGIREAAISALLNSLGFASKNFDIKEERDVIIQAICQCTQSRNEKVRLKAYECIAKIPDYYYESIVEYIQTFYQLTTNAITSDIPAVVGQAIEFWTTISLAELDTISDMEECNNSPEELAKIRFHRIIEQVSKPLIPLLLKTMTRQPDSPEDDPLSYIADSAAVCLDAIARIIKDHIVDEVLPFITTNILSTDWHFKEASISAFGTILDGPSDEKMVPILIQAVPVLVPCMKDGTNATVRGSTAWTIGRICQLHKNAIRLETLPVLVDALVAALDDEEASVSAKACYAIHNLAKACEDDACNPSNVLSPYISHILQKLFIIAQRPDSNEENLRSNAYEASNSLICSSALDMYPVIGQALIEGLNRLENSLNPGIEMHERMNLQSHLCSLIGECVRKLPQNDATLLQISDRMMQLVLQILRIPNAIAHDDALYIVGHLTDKLGTNFGRYLEFIKEPLIGALRNVDQYQVCMVALGTVGDICRALNGLVTPICDDVMTCIMSILRSNTVDR